MAITKRLTSRNKSVRYLVEHDRKLAYLIDEVGPIEYHIKDDPYGFLVYEIIEQMLSIKAAHCIHNRLLDLCDGNVSPQRISALSDEELKSIGTSSQKARYIRNLTRAVEEHAVDLTNMDKYSDQQVVNELTSIPGIGMWTAKMFLIFVLDRPDVLPYEDGAFKQSFKWLYGTEDTSKESIIKQCSSWSPYSSIGARYLYRALDSGLTKKALSL